MSDRTKKRLDFLLGVMVVVAILLICKTQFSAFLSSKTVLAFPDLKKNNITSLDLISDKQTTHLYKKNSHWFAKEKDIEMKADTAKVSTVINAISQLKKTEAISNNKKNHIKFGINKKRLEFKDKSTKKVIFIGDPVNLGQNYIRIDNENEVFATGGFSTVFNIDEFRDLSVNFILNEDEVSQIKLQSLTDEFTVMEKTNDWYINDQKVEREKVTFFINDLKTVKANDILTADKIDLKSFTKIEDITIEENDSAKAVHIYKEDENNFDLSIDNSLEIYRLNANTVASLIKTRDDFLQPLQTSPTTFTQ